MIWALAAAVAAPAMGSNFLDRPTFESAASSAGIALSTESFEEFDLDPMSAARSEAVADNFTLSAVNEGFAFLDPLAILGPTGPGGTFATDGSQHVNVGSLFSSAQNNDVVLSFSFDSPRFAFFLDLADLNGLDQAPSPRAILSSDAGDSLTIFEGQGQDLFTVGFINTAGFTEVTLRATAGDSFGVDAVTTGIPAPGSMALLGGVGVASMRRKC